MWFPESVALTCLALVCYSYCFYPVLIRLLASRQVHAASAGDFSADLPEVAVVIAAYNEERHIAARIENLLTLSYPAERLRIYIGDDGSKDASAAVAGRFASERVTVHAFARNRGKASVLNDLLDAAQAPIIVFSDANTLFERGAIEALVAPFLQPEVGAVCGELNLFTTSGANVDSVYWRAERSLKKAESQLGGLLGANGAIYAIRRDLWQPLPPNTICDDFVVAMRISAQGRRVVYNSAAVAHEEAPEEISDEYGRRLRIGIGNYQALFEYPQFITRTPAAIRFTYISHKVLRWLAPHLVILALAASLVAGTRHRGWLIFGLLQAAGLLVAGMLYRLQNRGDGTRLPKYLRLVVLLYALNAAFLVASVRYFRGQYAGHWQRTSR